MVVMLVVQMPIMEIVGVAVVRHGLMPARRAVHMTMAGVFVAFTFHRINLHSNQIANGVQEDVGRTAPLNPVLVLLLTFIRSGSGLVSGAEQHLLCTKYVSPLNYNFGNRCYHHCRCAR